MQSKYGFVYIWRDRKHQRYYIGAHWGAETDSYVCSSPWMKQAYYKRPNDFKRRILVTDLPDKVSMFLKEAEIFQSIKPEELGKRYYNLSIKKGIHWSATCNASSIAKKSGLVRRGTKLGPRPQEVKDKISKTKKARGQSEDQFKAAQENLKKARTCAHSDTAQEKRSDSLKLAYSEGRHSKRPKKEQRPLYAPGERQKQLWADPEWAANQREKLRQGAARRRAGERARSEADQRGAF